MSASAKGDIAVRPADVRHSLDSVAKPLKCCAVCTENLKLGSIGSEVRQGLLMNIAALPERGSLV